MPVLTRFELWILAHDAKHVMTILKLLDEGASCACEPMDSRCTLVCIDSFLMPLCVLCTPKRFACSA